MQGGKDGLLRCFERAKCIIDEEAPDLGICHRVVGDNRKIYLDF
jgi:hypothetical protein